HDDLERRVAIARLRQHYGLVHRNELGVGYERQRIGATLLEWTVSGERADRCKLVVQVRARGRVRGEVVGVLSDEVAALTRFGVHDGRESELQLHPNHLG